MKSEVKVNRAGAVGYYILWRVWWRLLNQFEWESMDLVAKLRDAVRSTISLDEVMLVHSLYRYSIGDEPEVEG